MAWSNVVPSGRTTKTGATIWKAAPSPTPGIAGSKVAKTIFGPQGQVTHVFESGAVQQVQVGATGTKIVSFTTSRGEVITGTEGEIQSLAQAKEQSYAQERQISQQKLASEAEQRRIESAIRGQQTITPSGIPAIPPREEKPTIIYPPSQIGRGMGIAGLPTTAEIFAGGAKAPPKKTIPPSRIQIISPQLVGKPSREDVALTVIAKDEMSFAEKIRERFSPSYKVLKEAEKRIEQEKYPISPLLAKKITKERIELKKGIFPDVAEIEKEKSSVLKEIGKFMAGGVVTLASVPTKAIKSVTKALIPGYKGYAETGTVAAQVAEISAVKGLQTYGIGEALAYQERKLPTFQKQVGEAQSRVDVFASDVSSQLGRGVISEATANKMIADFVAKENIMIGEEAIKIQKRAEVYGMEKAGTEVPAFQKGYEKYVSGATYGTGEFGLDAFAISKSPLYQKILSAGEKRLDVLEAEGKKYTQEYIGGALLMGMARRPVTTAAITGLTFGIGTGIGAVGPTISRVAMGTGTKAALARATITGGKIAGYGLGGLFIGGTTLSIAMAGSYREALKRAGESLGYVAGGYVGIKSGLRAGAWGREQFLIKETKIPYTIKGYKPEDITKMRSREVKMLRSQVEKVLAKTDQATFKRFLVETRQGGKESLVVIKYGPGKQKGIPVEGTIVEFGKYIRGQMKYGDRMLATIKGELKPSFEPPRRLPYYTKDIAGIDVAGWQKGLGPVEYLKALGKQAKAKAPAKIKQIIIETKTMKQITRSLHEAEPKTFFLRSKFGGKLEVVFKDIATGKVLKTQKLPITESIYKGKGIFTKDITDISRWGLLDKDAGYAIRATTKKGTATADLEKIIPKLTSKEVLSLYKDVTYRHVTTVKPSYIATVRIKPRLVYEIGGKEAKLLFSTKDISKVGKIVSITKEPIRTPIYYGKTRVPPIKVTKPVPLGFKGQYEYTMKVPGEKVFSMPTIKYKLIGKGLITEMKIPAGAKAVQYVKGIFGAKMPKKGTFWLGSRLEAEPIMKLRTETPVVVQTLTQEKISAITKTRIPSVSVMELAPPSLVSISKIYLRPISVERGVKLKQEQIRIGRMEAKLIHELKLTPEIKLVPDLSKILKTQPSQIFQTQLQTQLQTQIETPLVTPSVGITMPIIPIVPVTIPTLRLLFPPVGDIPEGATHKRWKFPIIPKVKRGYAPTLWGMSLPFKLKKMPKSYLGAGMEVRLGVKMPKISMPSFGLKRKRGRKKKGRLL